MASEEMIQVLRNHGAFAYGVEDLENIAREWEDYDFSPNQADAWLEVGCFRAQSAYELAGAGYSPTQVSIISEGGYRETVAYKFANSDLDLEDVKKLVEEVA
jgi:hypothetical protein